MIIFSVISKLFEEIACIDSKICYYEFIPSKQAKQLKWKTMKVLVKNMTSPNGNQVPNQFIINQGNKAVFQSYKTVVAIMENGKVTLDSNALEYSKTTLKYLKQFLNTNDSKKSLYAKIESGVYQVEDLNN